MVHTDLAGPVSTESIDGYKYVQSFTDDYSGAVFVYFLKNYNWHITGNGKFEADRSIRSFMVIRLSSFSSIYFATSKNLGNHGHGYYHMVVFGNNWKKWYTYKMENNYIINIVKIVNTVYYLLLKELCRFVHSIVFPIDVLCLGLLNILHIMKLMRIYILFS